MRIIQEAKSYATQQNAERALLKALNGREARWIIAVQSNGRFTPVVIADNPDLIGLVRFGVAVIK